jgi:putative addiction module component (TIGR02574 family)
MTFVVTCPMTLAELPQIQALSAREKLELVDEIWKSVSANSDSLEVTQDEQEILNSRWTDFLRNPASALSVDDFKSQINALRA